MARLADNLEQHSGFADVVASLREGHGGTIGGTWGSACALAVAAVLRTQSGGGKATAPPSAGTLVVVLPHAAEAEAFVDDVALFSDVPALLVPAGEDFAAGRHWS